MATITAPGAILDGLYARTEGTTWEALITLANGATLNQGQVVSRDQTALVGNFQATPQGDVVVVPSNTNAVAPVGVYVGATFTNSTGASQQYKITLQREGVCQVRAQAKTAGTAVTVGSTLILNGTDDAPISGTAALGVTIGVVLATGAVTAKGGTIIAVPGSGATTQLVTCDVNLR